MNQTVVPTKEQTAKNPLVSLKIALKLLSEVEEVMNYQDNNNFNE